MTLWTPSTDTPSLRTGAASAGDMDAVEVPFPATAPLNAGGPDAAPKFFRVQVTANLRTRSTHHHSSRRKIPHIPEELRK